METCETDKLKEKKQRLIQYMYDKINDEDWHGVADAAMDLREIEAKLSVLEKR